jgi:hypothetical protein
LGQVRVPTLQTPVGVQVPVVSVFPVQLGVPQAVGRRQAPLVGSQSVGSQVASGEGAHAAMQQLPLPATPQTPDVQASLVVQEP